jgi:hypothetical protein
MTNNKISEQERQRIMLIPGMVRGVVFKTDFEYILNKLGEEKALLLKNKLSGWKIPINYQEIKPLDWYPVGLRVISLLAIQETFGWGDKEIFNLGSSSPKYSFPAAMLMKYFVSIRVAVKEASKLWQKHYSVGKLVVAKIDEKEVVLQLKDFKIHPVLCVSLEGYFFCIAHYVIRSKEITIQETKCVFRGDPFHEYSIKWK